MEIKANEIKSNNIDDAIKEIQHYHPTVSFDIAKIAATRILNGSIDSYEYGYENGNYDDEDDYNDTSDFSNQKNKVCKKITLQQFKAAKSVVLETFPFSMYRYSGIALVTVKTIRDVQTGDPVHDLTDTWCGQESWYCARESECTEKSWQDHSRHDCLSCEVQAAIE